jgi:spore coat protein A, manganese oxidase
MKTKLYPLFLVLLIAGMLLASCSTPSTSTFPVTTTSTATPTASLSPTPVVQVPLDGSTIPQFVEALPLLDITGAPSGVMKTIVAGSNQIVLDMREFKSNILPAGLTLPGGEVYSGTYVWGYLPGTAIPTGNLETYIGPVIVAQRNTPTEVKYVNDLGTTDTTQLLFYKNATDMSIHWANPFNTAMMNANPSPPPERIGSLENYSGPILAVPHLHGGEIPPVVDGGPNAWFASDGSAVGAGYYSKDGTSPKNYSIYRYPNTQAASPIWFHDHVLGLTRLNVYAGLAGAYMVTDPAMTLPDGLGPAGLTRAQANASDDTIVPLVIQDRMFDTNGQLYFPNQGINPEHPYWIPEFLGDVIVVNGKSWPYMDVKAQRYRFFFLNGSNARGYKLSLQVAGPDAAPKFWQIETDGGYLDNPAGMDEFLLMPGERADIIIDFAGLKPGTTLVLANTAGAPYPDGDPVNPDTTGRIMQFRVTDGAALADDSYNPASGIPLRSDSQKIVRLVDPLTGELAEGVTPNLIRALTLNESMLEPPDHPINGVNYEGGPDEVIVNNTEYDGVNPDSSVRSDFTPITAGGSTIFYSEMPREGDIEVWEVINLTADAHPIHLHLVQFQLINRQSFDEEKYGAAYDEAFTGGGFNMMTGIPFAAGEYMPGYGPPLTYGPSDASGGKYGGNPDVTPYLKGDVQAPNNNEAGWKDTVMMPPGTVSRIAVRFMPTETPLGGTPVSYVFDPAARGQGYVWHCHIIDHEDNEMMRPDYIQVIANAIRTYVLGIDY